MKEFIKCIQEDTKPPVGGFDGKISVQMGYAAKESLTKGSFVKIIKRKIIKQEGNNKNQL